MLSVLLKRFLVKSLMSIYCFMMKIISANSSDKYWAYFKCAKYIIKKINSGAEKLGPILTSYMLP